MCYNGQLMGIFYRSSCDKGLKRNTCRRLQSRHCRYNIIPKEFQYEFLSCTFHRTSVLTFRNACLLYRTLFTFVRKHCLVYSSIVGLSAGQIEEFL